METLFELGSNLMIILQTLLQTLFLSDAVHRLEMIYTMKSENHGFHSGLSSPLGNSGGSQADRW